MKLIEQFLLEIVPKLKPGDDIGNSLNAYLARQREKVIDELANETKLSKLQVNEMFKDYEFLGHLDSEKLTEELNNLGYGFLQKRKIKRKVEDFIEEADTKYSINI